MDTKYKQSLGAVAGHVEAFTARLRRAGMRLTPQRVAVLECLAGRTDHPSAEAIYQAVRGRFSMVTRATVYNTLATLAEVGEAQELGGWYALRRFDGNPAPHPHIICLKCRRIDDVPMQSMRPMSDSVAALSRFQVVEQQVEFYGYCPECQVSREGVVESSPVMVPGKAGQGGYGDFHS